MLKSFVCLIAIWVGITAVSSSSQALTRVPTPGTGEVSLLYWRYLCRGQPQEQAEIKGRRELSCPTQRWRVRTHLNEDKVVEVVEDAA